MARRIKEKKERSLGVKLFIKAERCNSPKCVMVRRPQRPGQHGKRRRTVSEFGTQLMEKQKIQLSYGLTDRQMKKLFSNFESKEDIMKLLESRLDRIVFLLGIAASQRVARQLVSHGHIIVNGRKVKIPSYHLRKGDTISVRAESKKLKPFEASLERLKNYTPPVWLKWETEKQVGQLLKEPDVDSGSFPFNTDVVGEFYSR